MTTLLEIKPYIHDFIQENLDESFGDKIYWIGERVNIPNYPYCLLNVIAENKDKRTSKQIGELTENDKRQSITTRYKTCTITIGVYNAYVEYTAETYEDRQGAKEFAYEQIDNLEGAFEDYPVNKKFSIQNISPIRPLFDVVDGGYLYRYEFDLTIGYNEERITEQDIAEEIETDIRKEYDHNSDGADNTIYFEIDTTTETISGRIINK